MSRKGPTIKVEYSCYGCDYLERVEDDFDPHVGEPSYLCTAPAVIEKWSVPQVLAPWAPVAPKHICPYRPDNE